MDQDYSLFLSSIEPFSFLSQEDIRRISDLIEVEHYNEAKILFRQGMSKLEKVYILKEGTAERFYEDFNEKNSHMCFTQR